VANLCVEVTLSDLWSELHFLDGNVSGLLTRFFCLLRFLVTELPVVHDATHWRISKRRNFDEVEVEFAGQYQRVSSGTNAYLASIGSDEANLARTDALVVSRFIVLRRNYDLSLLCNGPSPPLCPNPTGVGLVPAHEADTEQQEVARILDLPHLWWTGGGR